MAKQISSLRHVLDEEAEEVRELLHSHDIPFYETNAGNWGISVAAIWLPEESDYDRARSLLDEYQLQRDSRNDVASKASRRHIVVSILSDILNRPLQFFVMLLLAASILTLSVKPFFF